MCKILGYANPSDVAKRHCKYAKVLKPMDSRDTSLPPRGVLIIPESDLYRLILKSQMKEAAEFQDWVTEEVLPQIRQTGGYIPNPSIPR